MLMVAAVWIKEIVPEVPGDATMKSLAEVETVWSKETLIMDWRHDVVRCVQDVKGRKVFHCEQWSVEARIIADVIQRAPVPMIIL